MEIEETRVLALALPDRDTFIRDIKAINEFQKIVHQHLVEGADWGIIPGTTKPTLLKPGAEKIAKLLGLADQYEIVDKQEDWSKPFFRYLIRCKLIHVATQSLISEGLGECNSMESKYRYRWVSERDLPSGVDKTRLIAQERTAKTGGHWLVFRLDNEDIYSQVNTILKMAKKRALVDAALSAGRLSNIFTQDIEDMGIIDAEVIEKPVEKSVDKTQHWCPLHNTQFFKKGKMKGYAHKIEGTNEWCNEEQPTAPETSLDAPEPKTSPIKEESKAVAPVEAEQPEETTLGIDMGWVRDSMKQIKWSETTVKSYLANIFKVSKEGSLEDIIARLSQQQKKQFTKEIQDRLDMA